MSKLDIITGKVAFCIGNAESRKGIDLEKYRQFGKLYGCNALTRDLLPDVITAVDNGIMHEIFHKGIGYMRKCYFRNWNVLPEFTYDTMIKDGNMTDEEMKFMRDRGYLMENERTDKTKGFVMHGSAIEGVANIVKKRGELEKKNVKFHSVYVSWVDDEKSKVVSISDLQSDRFGKKDLGWAAGPTSGYVACKEEGAELGAVFLLGHDLFSDNLHVNNMYKSTKHYVTAEHQPTPCINWIRQWRDLMWRFKGVKFYKVQPTIGDPSKKSTMPVLEWEDVPNIKYIDYSTLDIMLKRWYSDKHA